MTVQARPEPDAILSTLPVSIHSMGTNPYWQSHGKNTGQPLKERLGCCTTWTAVLDGTVGDKSKWRTHVIIPFGGLKKKSNKAPTRCDCSYRDTSREGHAWHRRRLLLAALPWALAPGSGHRELFLDTCGTALSKIKLPVTSSP